MKRLEIFFQVQKKFAILKVQFMFFFSDFFSIVMLKINKNLCTDILDALKFLYMKKKCRLYKLVVYIFHED